MNRVFGFKQQMTQSWDQSGRRIPVTILLVKPMVVTQVKHVETDGYEAIQVGIGSRKLKSLKKPQLQHLLKAKIETTPRYLKEINLDSPSPYQLGDMVQPSDIFHEGDNCAVSGLSKGRGFAGVMKRHGFKGGPKTHGQSDRARAPGSIGQGTDPGRVHKGKRMAGHYGNVTKWIKNLTIVKVDAEKQEIWIKGSIPGSRGSLVNLQNLSPKKADK